MSKPSKGALEHVRSHLETYAHLISFFRFYPDLMYDFINTRNITFNLYQRMYMRLLMRSKTLYGVVFRGAGKTFYEVLIGIAYCLLYPMGTYAVTAQTLGNAASVVGAKFKQILQMFPLLENEIEKKQASKMSFSVTFKNGSILDILANSDTSKG